MMKSSQVVCNDQTQHCGGGVMQAALEFQTVFAWLEMLLVGGGLVAAGVWALAKFGELGYASLFALSILAFVINYFSGRIILQFRWFDGAGITNGSFVDLHLVILIYGMAFLMLMRRKFKWPVLAALTVAAVALSYVAVRNSTSPIEVRLGTSNIA